MDIEKTPEEIKRERNREKDRKWRKNNPDKVKAKNEKRRLALSTNSDLKNRQKESVKKHREANRDIINSNKSAKRRTLSGKMRQLYENHSNADKKAGYDCSTITDSEIRELFDLQQGKCKYTGVDLTPERGPYLISLDRIDSTKGHSKDNCQLVSWPINLLKQKMNNDEFAQFIANIKDDKNKIIATKPYSEFDSKEKRKITVMISKMKSDSLKAGQEFDITLEKFLEFRKIHGDVCKLSGCQVVWRSRAWNVGSIDRIDNARGHTMDNIQIVIWQLNRMKCNMTNDEAKKVIDYLK